MSVLSKVDEDWFKILIWRYKMATAKTFLFIIKCKTFEQQASYIVVLYILNISLSTPTLESIMWKLKQHHLSLLSLIHLSREMVQLSLTCKGTALYSCFIHLWLFCAGVCPLQVSVRLTCQDSCHVLVGHLLLLGQPHSLAQAGSQNVLTLRSKYEKTEQVMRTAGGDGGAQTMLHTHKHKTCPPTTDNPKSYFVFKNLSYPFR